VADAQYSVGISLMARASDPKAYSPSNMTLGQVITMSDSDDEACAWLSAAVAQGSQQARQMLTQFSGQLTSL
jgi:hypothetical protein